jgi:hypothetical protein
MPKTGSSHGSINRVEYHVGNRNTYTNSELARRGGMRPEQAWNLFFACPRAGGGQDQRNDEWVGCPLWKAEPVHYILDQGESNGMGTHTITGRHRQSDGH